MTTRPAAATSNREDHVRKVFVFAGILALTLPLLAQQQRRGGREGGRRRVAGGGRAHSAAGQRARPGSQRPPTPTGPAPRLPDGTVDLNGLWNGGGPVGFDRAGAQAGRDAAAAAEGEGDHGRSRDARDRRPAPVVHADGRAALDAVSVPLRAELHAQGADPHVHRPRGEHPQLPPDLHGRPEASARARSDLVRALDRVVRQQGHPRHRHRRVQ